MDELLKLVADLVGESYDDETREKVKAATQAAIDAATSTSSDELRASLKKREAEARAATRRADKAEQALADAGGETDERLAALRTEVEQHKDTVARLETEATTRKLRTRFARALAKADVPEDRREAALELASLDDVVLDDGDDSGLAGASAAVEQLRSRYAFLWSSEAEGNGSGHGGRRNGSDPAPNPPKPNERTPADVVRDGVTAALARRGFKVAGA